MMAVVAEHRPRRLRGEEIDEVAIRKTMAFPERAR
jgi:hypothetical protein